MGFGFGGCGYGGNVGGYGYGGGYGGNCTFVFPL